MKKEGTPFIAVSWKTVTPTKHPGTKGVASWRTVEVGNVRMRIVEYSPGYIADHWCPKGHVVFVLEGELVTELKNGKEFVMKRGDSGHIAENKSNPHMSRSERGAKLFVVDQRSE